MIDGLRLQISNKSVYNKLLVDLKSDIFNKVSEETAEITKQKVKHKGLWIIMHPNNHFLTLHGSLNKFYNDGNHNYQDFTYARICEAILKLENFLGINASNIRLTRLEISVDVIPPILVNQITNQIISHRRKMFKYIEHSTISDFKICTHLNFSIKVYDKALQNSLNNNILRIEVKLKSKELLKFEIRNLEDLKNKFTYITLNKILVQRWNEILIIDDTVDKSKLSSFQKESYQKWINPLYWGLIAQSENLKKFNTERERYDKIVFEFSDRIQFQISELIKNKWEFLMMN